MTSKRNKAVLESMLDKIDRDLEKEHKLPTREDKKDKFLAKDTSFDDANKAPNYEVPPGCPRIYLERTVHDVHELYVNIDCKKTLSHATIKNAIRSLRAAESQAAGQLALCIAFTNDTMQSKLSIEEKYGKLLDKEEIQRQYENNTSQKDK